MPENNTVCELHATIEKMLMNMDNKLDAITTRQITYIEEQAKIKGIVTNGLSANLIAIKDQLDSFCSEAKKRLDVLESFSWFRIWMNGLRDNLMKNILLIAILGGGLYILINYGEGLLKRLLP